MLPPISRKRSCRLTATVGLALLFQAFAAGAHATHDVAEPEGDCVVCIQLDRTDPGLASSAPPPPAVPTVTAPDTLTPRIPCGRGPIAPSSRGPPAFC